MTLISVHNSDGCVGRCDSRCYDATSPDCDCICGGRNHGAGLQRAQENTRQHAERILEDWKAGHPEDAIRFEAIQQELFGAEVRAMIDRACHGAFDVLARLAAAALPRRVVRFAAISLEDALLRWDGPEIPGVTISFDQDVSAESEGIHSICRTEQDEIEIQLDADSYLRFDRKRLLRAIRRAKRPPRPPRRPRAPAPRRPTGRRRRAPELEPFDEEA